MSELTQNILRGVDYDQVRMKRNANYAYLESVLREKNPLHLTTPDGPYCYSFYCENGMEIKRILASKKIYVPTLWPNVLAYEETLEKTFAENILPIPCDQRYTINDMKALIQQFAEILGWSDLEL